MVCVVCRSCARRPAAGRDVVKPDHRDIAAYPHLVYPWEFWHYFTGDAYDQYLLLPRVVWPIPKAYGHVIAFTETADRL